MTAASVVELVSRQFYIGTCVTPDMSLLFLIFEDDIMVLSRLLEYDIR